MLYSYSWPSRGGFYSTKAIVDVTYPQACSHSGVCVWKICSTEEGSLSRATAGQEDGSNHLSQVSNSVSVLLSGESLDASLGEETWYLPGWIWSRFLISKITQRNKLFQDRARSDKRFDECRQNTVRAYTDKVRELHPEGQKARLAGEQEAL